ncbi:MULTISPECIES: MarR family winged helix-turn-helix transcriptional regulator [Streptomyces]|uniref:MarR family transcriptional regulator n=1 Tax=Streptomyces chilikensis TaxID=1194079 RepID=A0ABV3ESW3_9ACTN|nr:MULTISPECIES: MarR family transcriptional regulator [Streptomyces]MDH6228771.1 DNA-binding MarR family transcriptional regulator [Streptomyces sp. MJP52]
MDTPHPGRADREGGAGPGLDEALLLDSQICFSLNAASRAFTALYRVVLKDLGLTYPQYLVMLVLWEDGTTPVKHLGERLRLDSGTLSPLLKRLEAAGLIRRQRSAADERSVHVHLTPEGVALREQARLVPRRVAAATGFDHHDARTLRTLLTRLTGALDEAARPETAPPGTR